MNVPVIRTEEYATVSELIDALLRFEGKVNIIETPIKMGIDGDFYPSTFADATHLLRISLDSVGYPHIQHTHDRAWCISDYGDDDIIAEQMAEDGWVLLSTSRPAELGDWVLFVPYDPDYEKVFWFRVPNDQYTMWFSRAAELKPYLKEPPIPQE